MGKRLVIKGASEYILGDPGTRPGVLERSSRFYSEPVPQQCGRPLCLKPKSPGEILRNESTSGSGIGGGKAKEYGGKTQNINRPDKR